MSPTEPLDKLLAQIRACRICIEQPKRAPLPHAPRPIVRAAATARLAIFSQAPGIRVHQTGVPFNDPSGVRLRAWMGVTAEEFYDERRVAFVPMGFCFPGHDAEGGDLPPRPECAPHWRGRVVEALRSVELVLLVGSHAQRWHLPQAKRLSMTETVRSWRYVNGEADGKRVFPLPHPSWRNNAWIKRNPWFEAELLPQLRKEVRGLLD